MKKLRAIAIVSLFSLFSFTAVNAEVSAGVSMNKQGFGAFGKETNGTTVTEEYGAFADTYASVFVYVHIHSGWVGCVCCIFIFIVCVCILFVSVCLYVLYMSTYSPSISKGSRTRFPWPWLRPETRILQCLSLPLQE